ncbi:hypothetical protein ACFHW2_34230 [Actinomadura sp. LOL_016]|uniref:hypothetical protein n=1 Tax=unclassified Actinomadura TaxID=2626254 RepID=UPI003A8045A9
MPASTHQRNTATPNAPSDAASNASRTRPGAYAAGVPSSSSSVRVAPVGSARSRPRSRTGGNAAGSNPPSLGRRARPVWIGCAASSSRNSYGGVARKP